MLHARHRSRQLVCQLAQYLADSTVSTPSANVGDVPQVAMKRTLLRSGCRSVFLFFVAVLRIVRARSTGSTVLRTAAQPMPCVGASLISSPNPSAACPSGCPGSVGHSYAMLRQQAKNACESCSGWSGTGWQCWCRSFCLGCDSKNNLLLLRVRFPRLVRAGWSGRRWPVPRWWLD